MASWPIIDALYCRFKKAAIKCQVHPHAVKTARLFFMVLGPANANRVTQPVLEFLRSSLRNGRKVELVTQLTLTSTVPAWGQEQLSTLGTYRNIAN